MGYRLAVDLGTTYTGAAAWRDGAAQSVPLGARATAVPSVIFLRADGRLEFGEVAAQRGRSEPDHVAREFKRRIGDPVPISLPGGTFTAEQLMGELLAWVLALAAEREGGPPDLVALTHPANWGEYRLERLDEVARHARLPHYLPLTEPEAAAIHYASLSRVEDGSLVAVYDLGGGTFDATLLEKDDGRFNVLGEPTGIDKLGGADFDDVVLRLVFDGLGDQFTGVDSDDPAIVRDLARLREECVEAKEYLSSQPDAVVPVNVGDLRTQVRINRSELEERIAPLVDLTVDALERTILSAGVEPSSLRSVLLVGGSSRIPVIATRITERLGRPVAVDAHPKDTVALGAARCCGLLDVGADGTEAVRSGIGALRATGVPSPDPPESPTTGRESAAPSSGPAATEPPTERVVAVTAAPGGALAVDEATQEPTDPTGGTPPPVAGPTGGAGLGGRRKLLVGAVLGGVVVIVAVVLALVLRGGGDGSGATPAPDVVDVTVPATTAWTDSGIDLTAGARVHITASGTIQHNPDAASTVGPDGDVNPTATTYNAVVDGKLVPGRHASLIARIGTQDAFFVGSSADFTASAPGRLQLGINDVGPENNSGQFDVEVTVNG